MDTPLVTQCRISERRPPPPRRSVTLEQQNSDVSFPRAEPRHTASSRMFVGCIIFTLIFGTSAIRAQEQWSVTEGARADVTGIWHVQRGARDPQWRFGGYYLSGHAEMSYPTGHPPRYELRGTVASRWGTTRGILQRYEFQRRRASDGVGCRYEGLLEHDGIIRGEAFCGPHGQIKVPWTAKTR